MCVLLYNTVHILSLLYIFIIIIILIEENATIQMISEIQSDVDQDNVNASAKKVETLLKTIIKRSGGASKYKQSTRKSTTFPKKHWFDTGCKEQKHTVNKAKKDFQENPANVITRDKFY